MDNPEPVRLLYSTPEMFPPFLYKGFQHFVTQQYCWIITHLQGKDVSVELEHIYSPTTTDCLVFLKSLISGSGCLLLYMGFVWETLSLASAPLTLFASHILLSNFAPTFKHLTTQTLFTPTLFLLFQPLFLGTFLEDINNSVVPEVFQLSTERRAKERLEFERAVSEKEALRARVEEAQRMELEECEKEKMARLRQEQVTTQTLDLKPFNLIRQVR